MESPDTIIKIMDDLRVFLLVDIWDLDTMSKKARSEGKVIEYTCENFIKTAKKKFVCERNFPTMDINKLNVKQKLAYDTVKSQLEQDADAQLNMIINGFQGTGKSTLIQAYRQLFEEYGIKFKVYSFTGMSSYAVGGETLHRGLGIGFASMKDGMVQNVDSIKEKLKDVKFIIVDEFSMTSAHMVGFMDQRLRAVFDPLGTINLPFGGVSVIFMGDVSQLPPVVGNPLYSPKEKFKSNFEKLGGEIYSSIKTIIVLDEIMRQKDESGFAQLLNRLRNGTLTPEDEVLLKSREFRKLSKSEQQKFLEEDITFIFGEREPLTKFNLCMLQKLGNTIHEIIPGDSARSSQTEKDVLHLSVGAEVMCTANIWHEAGLYNGARGTVTELGFDEGGEVETVFVKWNAYHGPKFLLRADVPIRKVKRPAYIHDWKCYVTRNQFPLIACYSITGHKCQGMTLNRVAICLPIGFGGRSQYFMHAPTLLYVSASRVRRIEDLVIATEYRPEAVVGSGNYFRLWSAEERRLRSHQTNRTI